MPFLQGRATFLRFRASGEKPALFDESHLEQLREHQAGRQKIASADGVEYGWSAGDHVLDLNFTLEKQIVNDALCFDLRIDTDRLPGDLLRAYYVIELHALAKNNPSGFASAKQKREARETARDRLEGEAKDGRFKKRKCVPVLWDRISNEVLFGSTSVTHVDRLCSLFQQTFGMELLPVMAGFRAAIIRGHTEYIVREATGSQPTPSTFIPGVTPSDLAWIATEDNTDFLGNEFFLWLWYHTDVESDTLTLPDKSELTLMLARSLVVDCPRGQTGIDGFKSDSPVRLPEARRAIQAGKLPRKVGLTFVRHSEQYELTLHAETLAVGGAKLPPSEEEGTARAKLEDRVTKLREMIEGLDLLYARFLSVRLSPKWSDELSGMQKWLKRDERRAA